MRLPRRWFRDLYYRDLWTAGFAIGFEAGRERERAGHPIDVGRYLRRATLDEEALKVMTRALQGATDQ